MKTTPFTEKHIALGAKMHEFAGYNMPIEYSGIIDEHLTVCNAVGVFDVSHMGELMRLCSRRVRYNIRAFPMKPGGSSMTCWCIAMSRKSICWW